MTRTGRCACGAVRWRSDADPLWAGHCHCESCRRASSAAVTSFFGLPRDSVTWTGDIMMRESSPGGFRGFCPGCGSQMCCTFDRWPEEIHLFAASLDNPAQFTPMAHFHFAERVPWLTVEDDLPKYPGSADSTEPL